MSRNGRFFLGLALAAGLCAAALEGAPKPKPPAPPATCPTCPIVYAQKTLGLNNSDLVLMQPDGTGKTVILSGGQYETFGSPTFAPDGEWIAASGSNSVLDGKFHGIWLVRWNGESPTQALWSCSGGSNLAWRPVPSATGRYWLVFSDNCGSSGLWAVEVDLGTTPPTVSQDKFCLSCEGSLGLDGWGEPAFSSDGTHLSAHRSMKTPDSPYSYYTIVYDFIDGNPPRLEQGRVIEVPGLGTSFLGAKWAHGRNSLVGYSLGTGQDLWWLDIDHTAEPTEPMITYSGCLTCLPEDAFNYGTPHWSQDDQSLIYFASSSELGGLFVSPFESFVRGESPIVPSSKKVRVYSPSWNPNPNPQRP